MQVTRLPMITLGGRVVDAQQHPVAGVTAACDVQLRPGTMQSLTAVTGADGSYQLAQVPASAIIGQLWLEKEGYRQPVAGNMSVAGKETLPDIVLGDALLTGTVRDAETGAPLTGARISLLEGGQIYEDTQGTDKNGRFAYRLRHTQPANITLFIAHPPPDYLPMKAPDVMQVEVQAGRSTAGVVLPLRKGYNVTGTVTDGKSKPVAGPICIYQPFHQNGVWSADDRYTWATTDPHGHFTAYGLPAGQGQIEYSGPSQDEWEEPAPISLKVPAKGPIALTLMRRARQTVRGRVVDTQHHPVGGAYLYFTVFHGSTWREVLTAMTDNDGSYKLKIPMGFTVSLLASEKEGYRLAAYGLQTNKGGDRIGDPVMAPCTALVHGKVCDTDGKPVPGAAVLSMEGGRANRAITDATGAFTLHHQPACALHLIAATSSGGGLATVSPLTEALPQSPSPAGKPEQEERSIFGKDVFITCKPARLIPPCDTSLALALLDADGKLPPPQRRFNRTETLRLMADIDLDQVVRLCANGREPVAEGLRAYLLARQAEREPAQVRNFLVQLNLLKSPVCKLYAAVELGIAVVKDDPELAEQLYLMAKPIYDSSPYGYDDARYMAGLLRPGIYQDFSQLTIALAALLHKDEDVDAMLAHLRMLARLSGDSAEVFPSPALR